MLTASCATAAPPPSTSASTVTIASSSPPGAAEAPPAAPAGVPPEVLSKRLAAVSVTERLPDLATEVLEDDMWMGAVKLEHIAAAIARAERDMFVAYRSRDGAGATIANEHMLFDSGHFVPWNDSDVSTGLLAAYGASTLFAYAPSATGFLLMVQVEPRPLPDRTPGLVWSVGTSFKMPSVLFVSLDGETYEVALAPDGASFDLDPGPRDSWSKPLSAPAFGRAAFISRRQAVAPLRQQDQAFAACAEKRWESALKAMPPEAQEQVMPHGGVVRDACRPEIAAWEKRFIENIEASIAERRALYDQAIARLVALGG